MSMEHEKTRKITERHCFVRIFWGNNRRLFRHLEREPNSSTNRNNTSRFVEFCAFGKNAIESSLVHTYMLSKRYTGQINRRVIYIKSSTVVVSIDECDVLRSKQTNKRDIRCPIPRRINSLMDNEQQSLAPSVYANFY